MIKGLKFLVDAGVGKNIEARLQTQKYDTLAVRDIDPKMLDIDILKLAVNKSRIVITMDKDFGELVFHSKQDHVGVLLLRLDYARKAEKLPLVQDILDQYGDMLIDSFCTYQNGKLRVRK